MQATSAFLGNLLTAILSGSAEPGAEGAIGSLAKVISES
jgi:hypothetical protein